MSRYVLGVSFSGEELYGALVEQTDEGDSVVQFTVSSADPEGFDPALPGDSDFSEGGGESSPSDLGADEDVTINFGDDGGQGTEPFGGTEDTVGNDGGAALVQSQLSTLLDACEDRGYEDPEIALCSPVGEIDEVELRLAKEEATDHSTLVDGKPLPADRSVLIGFLEDQYDGVVEDDRVGFVPLHPTESGSPRVLALIVRPGGPVLSTLATMQEQTLSRRLRVALLETEVSLYEGLARLVQDSSAASDETTAVVRVGGDDTFVLFMRGNTLLKFEHLPELTADDPVETVCSRVLLLRDEYGVGQIHHLLLGLEENEKELAASFREYFPEANTELVRSSLPSDGGEEGERYTTAIGVALRHLRNSDGETPFRPVNLLPGQYAARSFRFPVKWSVPVLLALIGVTTLGFVWYYVAKMHAIEDRQARLKTLNQEIEQVDRTSLERRVDTLKATASQYKKGMKTLDQLLNGSNKWSRELAELTRSVDEVAGLSIRQWRSKDGTVVLTGRANDRMKIVDLVRQLDGEIDAISSTEVRKVSLFDFKVTVPLNEVRPKVVDYWNSQQATQLASASVSEGAESEPDVPGSAGAVATPVSRQEVSDRKPVDDAGPWTIVVASLSNRESAEVVQDRFQERMSDTGHHVRVHYSLENSRYRVGVGGFQSRDRAREALQGLQAELPSDSWIHDRIPVSSEAPVTAASSTTG